MVFFIIYFSRSSWQLVKIWVLTSFYDYRFCYDVTAFTISNDLMLGWLIYGYILFYSDSNNCDKISDTSFLNSLMFVILFIGYIMIFIYCMLLCTVPCLYSFVRESAETQNARAGGVNLINAQVPSILASLRKTQYDPDKFQHETNCVICLIDYQPKDIVTQLRCDPRHYFHTECLEGWIKNGHNQCPFCRAPIENFASDNQNDESMDSDHDSRNNNRNNRFYDAA